MTHPWGRTVYLPPIYEGLTFMVNVWANFPKHVTRFRTKVGFQNQGSWNGTQFFRGGGVDQPRCKQLMVILWLIFLQKLICLGGGFKYLLFSPRNLGMMIQFDEQIFQICWNHQLLVVWVIIEGKINGLRSWWTLHEILRAKWCLTPFELDAATKLAMERTFPKQFFLDEFWSCKRKFLTMVLAWISWVHPPTRIPVTTRIITCFRIGDL